MRGDRVEVEVSSAPHPCDVEPPEVPVIMSGPDPTSEWARYRKVGWISTQGPPLIPDEAVDS